MLTPQEVSERSFNKASFGGYHMAMVDEFLDVLTEDYTALYQENATLKNKMKVLVEKVEEYRSTEDAMRKTLVTAQHMADEMIENAKKKEIQITQNAQLEADKALAAISVQSKKEEEKLAELRRSVESYINKLKALYQHEMDYLNGLSTAVELAPQVAAQPSATPTAGCVIPPAEEEDPNLPSEEAIRASLYQVLQEERAKEEEYQSAPVEEPDQVLDPVAEAPTRRMKFDNLKFGKDYEIS